MGSNRPKHCHFGGELVRLRQSPIDHQIRGEGCAADLGCRLHITLSFPLTLVRIQRIAMQIDPVSWAVGLTGCFIDWLITRNWQRITLGLIPLSLAGVVAGLVVWGNSLDRNELANKYLKAADAAVQDWEDKNLWQDDSKDKNSDAKSDAKENDTTERQLQVVLHRRGTTQRQNLLIVKFLNLQVPCSVAYNNFKPVTSEVFSSLL